MSYNTAVEGADIPYNTILLRLFIIFITVCGVIGYLLLHT